LQGLRFLILCVSWALETGKVKAPSSANTDLTIRFSLIKASVEVKTEFGSFPTEKIEWISVLDISFEIMLLEDIARESVPLYSETLGGSYRVRRRLG